MSVMSKEVVVVVVLSFFRISPLIIKLRISCLRKHAFKQRVNVIIQAWNIVIIVRIYNQATNLYITSPGFAILSMLTL